MRIYECTQIRPEHYDGDPPSAPDFNDVISGLLFIVPLRVIVERYLARGKWSPQCLHT
jgi:hypothetical protein